MNYKIKEKYDDFLVNEIINIPIGNGEVYYYVMSKCGYRTEEAVDLLAEHFDFEKSAIGYAGRKDEDAVTTQFISIDKKKIDSFEYVEGERYIRLLPWGKGNNRIEVGRNLGNSFCIKVRNLERDEAEFFQKIRKGKTMLVNYYGIQRFGLPEQLRVTHRIGENLLKGNYKDAMQWLILGRNITREESLNWLNCEEKYFQSISLDKINFYLSAWDSYVWNEQVKKIILDCGDYTSIVDEGIEFFYTELDGDIVRNLNSVELLHHNMNEKFEIVEVQGKRYGYVEVFYQVNNMREDNINVGRYMVNFEFCLPPGCYATNILRQIMWNAG